MVGVGDMVEGNYREGWGEIELEKRGEEQETERIEKEREIWGVEVEKKRGCEKTQPISILISIN